MGNKSMMCCAVPHTPQRKIAHTVSPLLQPQNTLFKHIDFVGNLLSPQNTLDVTERGLRVELHNGYCANDVSDVTLNIIDESLSFDWSEQSMMLLKYGGKQLSHEIHEYQKQTKKLNFRIPFYSHGGGELNVSHVIHMTFLDNRKTISEVLIVRALVECFEMAETELEARSISIPMVYLPGMSLPRVSRSFMRAVKIFESSSHRKPGSRKESGGRKLQLIKFFGDDESLQTAYNSAAQHVLQSNNNNRSHNYTEPVEDDIHRHLSNSLLSTGSIESDGMYFSLCNQVKEINLTS